MDQTSMQALTWFFVVPIEKCGIQYHMSAINFISFRFPMRALGHVETSQISQEKQSSIPWRKKRVLTSLSMLTLNHNSNWRMWLTGACICLDYIVDALAELHLPWFYCWRLGWASFILIIFFNIGWASFAWLSLLTRWLSFICRWLHCWYIGWASFILVLLLTRWQKLHLP